MSFIDLFFGKISEEEKPKSRGKAQLYSHYKIVAEVPDEINRKKRKPKLMALVDEDNCTGCQVCVPFCPVDCIEAVPREKYNIAIPPVQIRFDECIGCSICARACEKLTWDAIKMLPIEKFEDQFPEIPISATYSPPVELIAE